jgi:hypothetical protein
MFIKLNKKICISEYEVRQHIVSYGDRISYSEVSVPINDIFNLIPKRYHDDFVLRFMKITDNIPPHTDSGILSTINVYTKPDICKTIFYEIITDNPKTMQVENQTNGKIFSLASLKEVGSFVAKKDEVWLLDVSSPHSVVSSSEVIDRTAICLHSFKYGMNEVKEMLIETNNI